MSGKNFMAKANKHPGALRATAKRLGLISGGEAMTHADLQRLARSKNPTTRKRANLAETYAKFRPS